MKSTIWLIGASTISQEYSRILIKLKQPFEVIGRSESSALSFKKKTGCSVKTGGLKLNLKKTVPNAAIVAVGVQELFEVTKELINSGTKRILLEKPGAINLKEINQLNLLAKKKKTEILIAYNRRFYNSIYKLKDLIKKDGGVSSMNFEFTEWIHKVKPLQRSLSVREHWMIANSHVIDLAFHLCGKPKNWQCWQDGSFEWHPASARFCGAGITNKGIMFSYLSDWQSAGSWRLELMTAKRRYFLRPLEKLQAMKLGTTLIEDIKLEDKIDLEFKAGLFLQTKKFLEKDSSLFCSISEQVENFKIFYKIAGY